MVRRHVATPKRGALLRLTSALLLLAAAVPARPDAQCDGSATLQSMTEAYAAADLNDREAAGILLARFSFGARPGELRAVLEQTPAAWFGNQLNASADESQLQQRLQRFDAMPLSDAELSARYPSFSEVSADMRRFHPDSLPPRDEPVIDFTEIAEKVDAFAKAQGMRKVDPSLTKQLKGQKLVRAVHAANQLQEVMTTFWNDHFYTGIGNFGSRAWVLPFERDVLRPHALGEFDPLLQTAMRHPAILSYYQRAAEPSTLDDSDTLMARRGAALQRDGEAGGASAQAVEAAKAVLAQIDEERDLILRRQFWPATGPNLVLARNLLSLYTLGPEANVDERDIAETARVFTGWTVFPYGPSAQWFDVEVNKTEILGFAREDSFWFRADHHDARPKQALGEHFPGGSGLAEGKRLLSNLAQHPATAQHLADKLVERFAGDKSDGNALSECVASAFHATEGDIAQTLITLVTHPRYWRMAAGSDRVKTPLYLAASALRASGASVDEAAPVAAWVARMGQPLYSYQEPTGYPQGDAAWLASGALLTRFAFAQALADGAIEGVTLPPPAQRPGPVALAAPEFQLH